MAIAALVLWIVTAGIGSFMLARWVRGGGLTRTDPPSTHFPPARVFTHAGLAAAGLIVWIIYLATAADVWAWIAVADLVLVALLGALLVSRWAADGRAGMRNDPSVQGLDLAEQRIPRGPVVAHGVVAVSTLVLSLLAAIGVGTGMS